MPNLPTGAPTLMLVAPHDQNVGGGVTFGGWMMAQCDHACGLAGHRIAGTCVIRSFADLTFHAPLRTGTGFAIHTRETRRGRTSFGLALEGWADTPEGPQLVLTAHATLIALGEDGRPRAL